MTNPPCPRFRIASYNIRKAMGTDRRRDPHRIMGIIAELAADIVILQEADLRLGARRSALPIHELETRTGMVAVPIADNDVSLGWHGNTILLRPDIRVNDMQKLNLPGIEPRGAVIADVTIKGVALRVTAAHLGLLRSSRRRQLSALIEALDVLDATPTLIAGDFNERSLRVGLGRIAHQFTIYAPGKTYHANVPLVALDRIALDQNLTSFDGGVMNTPVARRASDHLPIWMDVGVTKFTS